MPQPWTHPLRRFVRSGSPPARLAEVLRPYGPRMAMTLVMLIGLSLANMAVPAFLGVLFNKVFEERVWGLLTVMLVALLVVYVIRNMLYYTTKYTMVSIGEYVSFELRKQLFERLQSRSMRFYRGQNPGRLSSRVMDDTFAIQSFIADEMPKLLQGVCLFLGLVVVIYVVNWQLALASTLVLPLHLFAARWFKDPIKRSGRDAQQRLASVHGSLIEKFLGMEVVKGFAAEDRESAKFVEAIDHSRHSQLLSKKFHARQKVVADLLVGLGTLALLGFGSYQVMKEDAPMQKGTFIAFFGYVGMLYPTVLVLMSGFAKMNKASASIERVFEMLDAPTFEDEEENAIVVPIRGKLTFENVAFAYDPSRPILREVSFHIPSGAVCAVTGPSGCGKTTLLSLVTRFIEPDRGRVLLDDVDARRMQLRHLRESVGVAFQETYLFNTSILENLRYASPDAPMDRIVEAARCTGAHEFIEDFPDGYHTMLGEAGINLSRGEKQRLVLTRALLKAPRILILDEATASVDGPCQARIMPAVINFMKGRTILIVTHRPEMLRYTDMTVRLEGGRVSHTAPPRPAEREPVGRRTPSPRRALSLLSGLLMAISLGAGTAHAAPSPPADQAETDSPSAQAAEKSGESASTIDTKEKTSPQSHDPGNGDDKGEAKNGAETSDEESPDTDEPDADVSASGEAGEATGGDGSFFPLTLTEPALKELFDVLSTSIQIELDYSAAPKKTAARLPDPPTKLTSSTSLRRESEGGLRLLQFGYRTYETRPPHAWVYGGTAHGKGQPLTPNPDVSAAVEMLRERAASIDPAFTSIQVEDLASKLITLDYIEPGRALALLKTLGYQTVEYTQSGEAVGGQTILKPSGKVDPKNLPIVVSIPGTDNTQLVGGEKIGRGKFGEGTTPSVAGAIPNNTNAAPVMQLMVLYHPKRPDQLSKLVERINNSIDLPARQILMEAMVLEISDETLDQLGVEWELLDPGERVNQLTLGRIPTGLSPETATANATLNDIFGDFRLRIRALVQQEKAKILSRPSVLTLNNRQAAIRVGQEIPIATSIEGLEGDNEIAFKFNYLSTGILLNIRPRVGSDGEEVSLQVDGVVSDEVPGEDIVLRDQDGRIVARAPQISTRRVQSHIRIANNTPFIIGGLIAEENSTTVEKVPVLGDLPLLGGLFRNRTDDTSRNEVIIVITPFVLPETGVVGRNLPKDKDVFDSFDNELFRDAYRIRSGDVFDLSFVRKNRYLRTMDTLANRAVEQRVERGDTYPFNQFVDDRFPGEHILVYRQMYEVIKRLDAAQPIRPGGMIFFQPDGESAAGFAVTFLEPYLKNVSGVSDRRLKELSPRQRADLILDTLADRGKALAMTYTRRHSDDVRDALSQPVPRVNIVDCPDEDTWGRLLWKLNQPGPDGRQRHTILLHDADDLTRLQRAIVLKRTVRLNSEQRGLSLSNFSVGRLLLMPDIESDNVYLIDSDTARYFFLTEHYYPAFAERLSTVVAALRDALDKAGFEIPRNVDPSLPPIPLGPPPEPDTLDE